MIGFVVTLCIEGLIGGVALRAILPGEQQWSLGQTFAFGLIAWLAVGFLFRAIFGVIFGSSCGRRDRRAGPAGEPEPPVPRRRRRPAPSLSSEAEGGRSMIAFICSSSSGEPSWAGSAVWPCPAPTR